MKDDMSEKDASLDISYDEVTGNFVQDVLDSSKVSFVRYLDRPSEILDVFREEKTFGPGEIGHIIIRDFEDKLKRSSTSECNRAIWDTFRRNPNNYLKLKSALVRTGHKDLLEIIEKNEAECHDTLKGMLQGCVCTGNRSCPMLERLKCKTKNASVKSDKIKDLQQYLIDVYEPFCEWENPVTGDDDENISRMYVNPDVKIIREKADKNKLVEVQHMEDPYESKQLSYRQVFYINSKPCINIYITGNAGMGKTTFCKQLLHTWCKVSKLTAEDEDLTDDDKVLREFTLLFYVSLRDVESIYHIEEMITETILANKFTDPNLPEILKIEKCLIVLDGLDEWSCPQNAKPYLSLNKGIPGRDIVDKTCVYLTTTRNWKFAIIDLKSRDIDKHVELCGFSKNSSLKFAATYIARLRRSEPKKEYPFKPFYMEVEEKKLTSLTSVPVLLTQLVTLWYFNRDLGSSQIQLYCNMINLLLEQTEKRQSRGNTPIMTKPVQPKVTLPDCFSEESSCLNHEHLILCLAKLAFKSLINKKREHHLVYKSQRMKLCGISESDINLCLKSGIFTQTKLFGNRTGRFEQYSFLHKKLQEFFAALYLVTDDNTEENMKQFKDYCNDLDTTLEMEQVLMFACGMEKVIGNQLLKHLLRKVSDDSRVQNSRQSFFQEELIKYIQDCVLACVTLGASNGIEYDLDLQDYFIDDHTISHFITHVVKQKKTTIKSVYMFMQVESDKRENIQEVLDHLLELHALEKLVLGLVPCLPVETLKQILNKRITSLKSLALFEVGFNFNALFTSILHCIPNLLSLRLAFRPGMQFMQMGFEVGLRAQESIDNIARGLGVTHSQIQRLMATPTKQIRHLLLNLCCTEHEQTCMPEKDLSNHTQLQTLYLGYMTVTNLHVVAQSVKHISLRYVTVKHDDFNKFITALTQASSNADVLLMGIRITDNGVNPVYIEAFHKGCGKYTVTTCIVLPDEACDWVHQIPSFCKIIEKIQLVNRLMGVMYNLCLR